VEYKVGVRREWEHEALQLCAQAMCLEEMLGCAVPAGAIYYCASRARREVEFTEEQRAQVERATAAIREMLERSLVPPAIHDARCAKCSLLESCLPGVVVRPGRLRAYRAQVFAVEEA
jgi:CRISPR-associated exonuclease Cas4